MVTADCAALPEALAESELFGHERGAFTGADRRYAGRIEAAEGGTLFLDEVNSLSLGMQAKLLRFLEVRELWRIGQQRPVSVDVRVLSATNVRLEDMVASGQMRADFFYRLKVLEINVPPLRERLDDLPLLVDQFFAEDMLPRQLGVTRVTEGVLTTLRGFPWTGNVRELWNTLRRSVADGADGAVLRRVSGYREEPLPVRVGDAGSAGSRAGFRPWIHEKEREYLADLVEHNSTMAQQVQISGLPERTLYRKLRALGLRRDE
jgi:transcriptional regulator with PAS, ATPase and Fis domain